MQTLGVSHSLMDRQGAMVSKFKLTQYSILTQELMTTISIELPPQTSNQTWTSLPQIQLLMVATIGVNLTQGAQSKE